MTEEDRWVLPPEDDTQSDAPQEPAKDAGDPRTLDLPNDGDLDIGDPPTGSEGTIPDAGR